VWCGCSGGCYALFSGQQKFHNELSSTLDDVVSQANTTVQGLHNVSAYLSQASAIDVESYGVPSDTKQNIQQLNTKIGQAADSLQNRTRSNAANIRKTINRMYICAPCSLIFLFENVLRSCTTWTDISSVPDVDNVYLSFCSQLALIIVSGVMLLLVLLGLCKSLFFF
jgi:hypothetical protein